MKTKVLKPAGLREVFADRAGEQHHWQYHLQHRVLHPRPFQQVCLPNANRVYSSNAQGHRDRGVRQSAPDIHESWWPTILPQRRRRLRWYGARSRSFIHFPRWPPRPSLGAERKAPERLPTRLTQSRRSKLRASLARRATTLRGTTRLGVLKPNSLPTRMAVMTSDSPATGISPFTKTWTLAPASTSVTARLACQQNPGNCGRNARFSTGQQHGHAGGFDAHSVHGRISILANDSDRYCLRGQRRS